jgi:hypothetical protein
VPEHEGFVIRNQISQKFTNFSENTIHKKTGQFKIIWSIFVNSCILRFLEKKNECIIQIFDSKISFHIGENPIYKRGQIMSISWPIFEKIVKLQNDFRSEIR